MIACVRIVDGTEEVFATADALAVALATFSDRVERIVEAEFLGAYVDLGPLSGRDAARALGATVGRTVREQCRVTPAVGLATGTYPARVAARRAGPNRLIVVEPGQESDFVAPRAIEYLPVDEETWRRLDRLGIHTLGQFAALPAGAVLQQFGRRGQFLHRLARGCDERPVARYTPATQIRAAQQFDDPIADATILSRILGRLAETCAAELKARTRVARHVQLLLETEEHTRHVQHRRLHEGITAADRLHRCLRQLLDRAVEGELSGIVSVEVRLGALDPMRGGQLDLFARQSADERRLAEALPALVARHGAESFYTVRVEPGAATLPERRYRFRVREDER